MRSNALVDSYFRLADTTLVVVQDEFDIQFRMEVSLSLRPAGTTIKAPVRYK
jgi:hypothetical protein